jgi:hypothetical protein
MNIKEVKEKYPRLKISHLPKKDYLIGITDTNYKIHRKDNYDDVYIAKNETTYYYLLYPIKDLLTGSFKSKQRAINFFKKGGR